MISWKERQDRIEARGAEHRAGELSEAMFAAYLFSMRERGEDLRNKLRDYAPAAPGLTYEDARLEESRRWLERYRHGRA